MLEAAHTHLKELGTCIQGDAADIQMMVPEKVDTVLCLNGFHMYIDRKEDFLAGCYQILNPGGTLIFDVSTRGLRDEHSKQFLLVQTRELKRLAKTLGTSTNLPLWPDETLLKKYWDAGSNSGFAMQETVTIDVQQSVAEAVEDTLTIPGRLRPWLPNLSDGERSTLYREASRLAKEEVHIEFIVHSRVFFIAKKPPV